MSANENERDLYLEIAFKWSPVFDHETHIVIKLTPYDHLRWEAVYRDWLKHGELLPHHRQFLKDAIVTWNHWRYPCEGHWATVWRSLAVSNHAPGLVYIGRVATSAALGDGEPNYNPRDFYMHKIDYVTTIDQATSEELHKRWGTEATATRLAKLAERAAQGRG